VAAKKFAHASETGGVAASEQALIQAYKHVFSGNGSASEAEMVLADLANMTAYYRRPNYGEWMSKTKSPIGFELHSALSNARAEVVQHILDKIMISQDRLVELERAARAEHEARRR
jgi:hypothetical protein